MTTQSKPEVRLPAVPPLSGNFKPEDRKDEYDRTKFFDAATIAVEKVRDLKTLTTLAVHIPGVGDAMFYIDERDRRALIRELAREDLF